MPRPLTLARTLGLTALWAVLPLSPLSGQVRTPHTPPAHASRWPGHATALVTNAAVGAITAGLVRAVRGEADGGAIAQGAAGGGLAYAGKVLGSRDFPLAGLVGRQTSALGASLVRNAATGEAAFGSLTVPLGPVRLRRTAGGTHLSIDLPTVAGTLYAFTRPGARLDLPRTLSTGALVFGVDEIQRQGDRVTLGRTIGGTILYRSDDHGDVRPIIAHETVHVLQHDFGMAAWGDPFEGWLATKLSPRLASPLHRLDLGSYASLKLLVLAVGITSQDTPWEREAYFLVQEPLTPGTMWPLGGMGRP